MPCKIAVWSPDALGVGTNWRYRAGLAGLERPFRPLDASRWPHVGEDGPRRRAVFRESPANRHIRSHSIRAAPVVAQVLAASARAASVELVERAQSRRPDPAPRLPRDARLWRRAGNPARRSRFGATGQLSRFTPASGQRSCRVRLLLARRGASVPIERSGASGLCLPCCCARRFIAVAAVFSVEVRGPGSRRRAARVRRGSRSRRVRCLVDVPR